jgi:cysteine desulfurase NifS/selenium donor protein
MADLPIYLDHNATTPIDPRVADAMLPYLQGGFGNPSSSHALGVAAKLAVERARASVAALIGARPEEIVLTSGGSEANNTVIAGVARRRRERGRHLVTSAVEHPAVLEPCRALAEDGWDLTILPVDDRGRLDPDELRRALRPDTVLATVMHANNEVGTIEPIAEVAAICREHDVWLHTDAAQSVGKIPVDVDDLGVDFLTIAGHKFHGPKGVGALYVRSGREIPSLIRGAAHEAGRRAGTENVLEIVGLGEAARIAHEELAAGMPRNRALRDRLHAGLVRELGELRVNGDLEHGLPNTLSVCFRGLDAATLLAEVGDRVAASAGAACHADGVDLSTVLAAMRVPLDEAMGTVRFSVGRTTSEADVDAAVTVVADAVRRLRPAGEAPTAAPAASDGPVRLTRFTHGMGCACKLRPQELEQVLRRLPASTDPAVMVDAATADDAAVYRLAPDLALVQTVDFFTPICDDPRTFGAISAANSLSDVYAMGARPRLALSVVGFPSGRLPLDVLGDILDGAIAVAAEAGIEIVGGHTVEDTEPRFGLAVTGTVHPDRVLTNAGARPGDRLVLTKPLGTGIVATAAKQDAAPLDVVAAGLATMRELNRAAAEAMVDIGVRACTDVTGFGLLGHLRELAAASGVDVAVALAEVPLLAGVRELAAADIVPGGSLDNLARAGDWTTWPDHASRVDRVLLADAQTSGGLLIAVAPDRLDALLVALDARGVACRAVIGECTAAGTGRIVVR